MDMEMMEGVARTSQRTMSETPLFSPAEGRSSLTAAMAIQRIVRGHIARTRFLKLRRGVIRLQAVFRGIKVRKRIKRLHESAKKIQTRYRAWKRVHKDRSDFLEVRKATEVIQKEWRRFKFRQGIE